VKAAAKKLGLRGCDVASAEAQLRNDDGDFVHAGHNRYEKIPEQRDREGYETVLGMAQ